jgi:formylglycine-generating enzyme required for sulfatase activity/predicted Ser/Thr protein kinase
MSMSANDNQQQLRKGTVLQAEKFTYTIQKVLGQGGFGITYLGTMSVWVEGPLGKIETKSIVAIKEFFMKDYCGRDATKETIVTVPDTIGRDRVDYYRNRFTKEANNVSKLSHPNIVKVLEVFEANNTAYIVMEYVDGVSLQEHVKKHGALSAQQAVSYIRQVAAALDYTHGKRMMHLDLKPANILLRRDGTIIVIDFGLSKQYNEAGEANSSSINPAGISEGYSPIELYSMGSLREFSPASDIYSLGATLYFFITAQTPPSASVLLEDDLPDYSDRTTPSIWNAIMQTMQPKRRERPQSVAAFLALLGEEREGEGTTVVQTPVPPSEPPVPPVKPEPMVKPVPSVTRPNKLALILTAAIAGVLLLVAAIIFFPSGQSGDEGVETVHVPPGTITNPAEAEAVTTVSTVDSISPTVEAQPATPAPTPTPKPATTSAPTPTAKPKPTTTASTPTPTPKPTAPTRQSFEPEMVSVQGGTFMMGSPTSEQGHQSDETLHQVTVSSFRMSKYEVTQGQWGAVMGTNPSSFKEGDNYPVESVSWNEVQTFLRKLNAATGKQYRLPTEAEWEYAARGGSNGSRSMYSGSSGLGSVAWYADNSGSTPHPVGQKQPNELGLYDMTGNVFEWCSDWFGNYPAGAQTNPKGASSSSGRVYRGGSWYVAPTFCRVAYRNSGAPGDRGADLGFRVVE